MSNKNPTIEDIRDGYNKLFNNTKGKYVGYKIISAKLNKLADDVYNSVKEDTIQDNNRDTKPNGLVARLVNQTETRQEQDNGLSL